MEAATSLRSIDWPTEIEQVLVDKQGKLRLDCEIEAPNPLWPLKRSGKGYLKLVKLAEVAERQTHRIQNPAGLKPREGSSPSLGTIL